MTRPASHPWKRPAVFNRANVARLRRSVDGNLTLAEPAPLAVDKAIEANRSGFVVLPEPEVDRETEDTRRFVDVVFPSDFRSEERLDAIETRAIASGIKARVMARLRLDNGRDDNDPYSEERGA